MCKLCKRCPFKESADLGFDQDGLDCLDEGREPSCHEIVGPNLQFNDPLPDPKQICRGYLNWQSGKPGFVRPYLEKDDDHERQEAL